ncbi:MAG: DUF2252 domain-containing protein [Acidimicrobiales bacterium]
MATTAERFNPGLMEPAAPPDHRIEAGRAKRDVVPLEAHAEMAADASRRDPLDVLGEQDRLRIPELLPLRYGRMSHSPFTYLRGAAAVMASDLAASPTTDLGVELCGDAHLGNFRWYNAPDRTAVFDVNDFDETLPGPFEWDVKRLAASVTVCARNSGFSKKKGRAATRAAMCEYRKAIEDASGLNPLELFYYRFDADQLLEWLDKASQKDRKHVEWKRKVLAKAESKNSMRAFKKLTESVDGRRVIVPDPPRLVRVDDTVERNELEQFYQMFRQTLPLDRRVFLDRFRISDVAHKVVGVGSVGTRCLMLLLEAGDGTPLFLQFKQAVQSVLEPYLGESEYEQSGRRVVEGQRLIQATSDVFLGWARWENGDDRVDFYFRQLWDGKGKIKVETLSPKRLAAFASLCGRTLGYAHARSGDAAMIRGYIGDDDAFDKILVAFADRYADLTERDHAKLMAAIGDGAIEVERDL